MTITETIKNIFVAYESLDAKKLISFYSDKCSIHDPSWDDLEDDRAKYWIQYTFESIKDHKIVTLI